jgi:hypothetical protein
MKRLVGFGLVLSCSALALAQSPFDGTWRVVAGSDQFPSKPDVYLLQRGIYHCPTCTPPLEIKANGQDQRISGEACYDTVSVKVLDDHTTEETDKRDGKTVATSRMTASSDGNTATVEWSESCNVKGDVIKAKKIMKRVAKRPPGSHAVSGSWQTIRYLDMSENAKVATMKIEDNTFYFADPAGQSYAAKLDGTDTPIQGDLSHTVVSVRRIDSNTVEETEKRNGKVTGVAQIKVSADGRTLTWSGGDKAKGTGWQFVAEKE